MVYKSTIYKCNFCGRSYNQEETAIIHEEECFFNPAKHHCFTCANYDINVKYCYSWKKDITNDPSLSKVYLKLKNMIKAKPHRSCWVDFDVI